MRSLAVHLLSPTCFVAAECNSLRSLQCVSSGMCRRSVTKEDLTRADWHENDFSAESHPRSTANWGNKTKFMLLQLAARCRGAGTEEGGEARVWWWSSELLLRRGLHLREHWEWAVFLHLTGTPHPTPDTQTHHTHMFKISSNSHVSVSVFAGETKHHQILAGQSTCQTGRGSSQYQLPGGTANQ